MSDVFTVWCADDAVTGPQLHRRAGGTGLIYPDAWGEFLIEHEYHQLALVHEAMDGARPPERPLRVEEAWEMGPDAAQVPEQFTINSQSFTEITAEQFQAAGWKLRRRLVTDWVDV